MILQYKIFQDLRCNRDKEILGDGIHKIRIDEWAAQAWRVERGLGTTLQALPRAVQT